jgi:hypothetical protein
MNLQMIKVAVATAEITPLQRLQEAMAFAITSTQDVLVAACKAHTVDLQEDENKGAAAENEEPTIQEQYVPVLGYQFRGNKAYAGTYFKQVVVVPQNNGTDFEDVALNVELHSMIEEWVAILDRADDRMVYHDRFIFVLDSAESTV